MKKIFHVIALILVFVGSASYARSTQTPANILAEAEKGGYRLISTDELQREYRENSDGSTFVDTRQDWAFKMQHIKGTAYLPVTPTWWYQFSPFARAEMRNVLGPDLNKKFVFY